MSTHNVSNFLPDAHRPFTCSLRNLPLLFRDPYRSVSLCLPSLFFIVKTAASHLLRPVASTAAFDALDICTSSEHFLFVCIHYVDFMSLLHAPGHGSFLHIVKFAATRRLSPLFLRFFNRCSPVAQPNSVQRCGI